MTSIKKNKDKKNIFVITIILNDYNLNTEKYGKKFSASNNYEI